MHTQPPTPAAARRPAAARAAFTMTELLIVIGLIVLVIAIAVPAFKAMSGGRSVDAAQNQLAAVLGVARAEAIGLQKVRGVFFYLDPATERVNAALVQEASYRPEPADAPDVPPDYYIDLVPDRDPVALPVGVGLQGIDNADLTPGAAPSRKDDGYIGYNLITVVRGGGPPPAPVPYGGVILFDPYGRVINKFYGFHLGQTVLSGAGKQVVPTLIGELLGYPPVGSPPPKHFVPEQNAGGTPMNNQPAQSLFGFVLYDAEPYRSAGFGAADPQYTAGGGGYGSGNERDEEAWLDQNGMPILINRYNGTLVRGE
jgi:type II secretory pathway pseudopilin PulG